jgi:hypothetical protein
MRQPEILGPEFWHLLKAIYGLKQSRQEWYLQLNTFFESIGFHRCESDWSIHKRRSKDAIAITVTSINDILLATNSKDESDKVSQEIKSRYNITDNSDVHWLLGCKITRWRSRRTLKLDQSQYVTQILQQYGMENCNPVSVPMNTRLTTEMSPKTKEEREEASKLPYRELVGKFGYLTNTRPDISFPTRELAKFVLNYGVPHWNAAKHLLQYLQGTRTYGIIYGNKDEPYPIFRTFTDSDWAQGELRKSVCGYVVEMGGGPIAWSSKQQGVIALSLTEAEYVVSTHAAKQILWTRSLMQELDFTQKHPSSLFCDNLGTIAASLDPQHHSRMKHMDLRYHFI